MKITENKYRPMTDQEWKEEKKNMRDSIKVLIGVMGAIILLLYFLG